MAESAPGVWHRRERTVPVARKTRRAGGCLVDSAVVKAALMANRKCRQAAAVSKNDFPSTNFCRLRLVRVRRKLPSMGWWPSSAFDLAPSGWFLRTRAACRGYHSAPAVRDKTTPGATKLSHSKLMAAEDKRVRFAQLERRDQLRYRHAWQRRPDAWMRGEFGLTISTKFSCTKRVELYVAVSDEVMKKVSGHGKADCHPRGWRRKCRPLAGRYRLASSALERIAAQR